MAAQALVLLVHDTTVLDFTSHHALTGAGPIGDNHGQGFLQHNSLAFTPDGGLLGLAYQQVKTRQPAPATETRHARKQRPRESQMWTEGIRACGTPPTGATWVDVGDRGADIYEAMEQARSCGHHFLFRLCQDRVVFVGEQAPPHGDEPTYLMTYARGLASVGTDVVEVPGKGGRPARVARVCLAAGAVRVPPPRTTVQRRTRPTLLAWVIRVWEEDPPAGVAEPLEWVLLCSLRTEDATQIKQRRDWYSLRWGAEVYHDVEKNGCAEQDRRFETAGALVACLAVLAVVAVRVYQLRLAVRALPAAPAEEVATADEVAVPGEYLGKDRLTVAEFVRGVAKLGGFLGRRSDGEPCAPPVWRGYQRLQDMVAGFRLRAQRPLAPPG